MTSPYEFEHFDGEPLFLERFNATFSVADHLKVSAIELAAELDRCDQPVFFVMDASAIKVSFGDMVSAMAQTASGTMSVLRHPNIRELLVVVANDMMRMGAKALGQAQYGGLKSTPFDSVDEALAYARGQYEA